MNKRELTKRYVLFFVSMLMASLGIAVVTKAMLGTTPISSIPFVLSIFTNGTIGIYTLYLNLALLLFAVLLMGKRQVIAHRVELILLLPITMAFALSIDLCMLLIDWYHPVSYLAKLVGLMVGCFFLALGITGEVKANVTMMAGEYFVRAVVGVVHKEFGLIKLCFDVSCVLVAIGISLAYSGHIEGLREGTVFAALITGPLTHIMMPWFNHLDGWLLGSEKALETTSQQSHDTQSLPLVITLSRQFGCGGRQLGELVAKQLGIKFYDKELIALAAQDSDLPIDYVEQNEQMRSPSDLLSLAMRDYEAPLEKSLTTSDRLFVSQSKVIRRVAHEGACLILGRCADYVLQDYPHDRLIRVYCYTTLEDAARRCVAEYGMPATGIEKAILDKNRARVAHYQHYTGLRWGDHNNYDLMLNTAACGLHTAANLICDLYHAKQQQSSTEQFFHHFS